MRRIIDPVSRYLVGGLFIFSGLIKLNDPVGTQIKLEEYFEVFAADFGSFFEVFIPWALEIGLVLIVLELVLGAAVLIYYRMEQTGWVLLGLMTFFIFLTFYSAYFNKVTDCGCFGDAIKLTPWQSFWKDVVLMIFVGHLFWYRKTYQQAVRTWEGRGIIMAVAVISIFTGVYAIRHLPFIDFRPYRIGNNIPEQMKAPEQPIIEFVFEKDGKEVRSQKYLMPDDGYTYKTSVVLNEDRIRPKITDYSVVSPEGEDITQATFTGVNLLILVRDAGNASGDDGRLRDLVNGLEGKLAVRILTSSSPEQIEKYRHENQIAAPYAFTDATVLKTMIRSNPGLVLLNDGTVLGHWHHNDIPSTEDILRLLPN